MTTIAFTTPRLSAHTAAASPRTRLRLTVRGRRVFAALAAVPAAVALSIAVVSGGVAVATSDAAPGTSFTEVVVAPGESLWSIAEEFAPSSDPRDVVDGIIRLNALDTVELQAGQVLALPAEYAP